jgi:hypothetical protein
MYKLSVAEQQPFPGVAKFGIALEWGSRGRWFESSHSDQKNPQTVVRQWFADFLSAFPHA